MHMKNLLYLVLILILTSFVYADFDAISSYGQVRLCQGSAFSDEITVTNTDDKAHLYAVQTGEWSSADIVNFELAPLEQANIKNIIAAPADAELGEYTAETRILEDTGAVKALKQTVNLEDCTTTVTIDENSFSNCQCTPTLYKFKIKNNADIDQTYDISVNLSTELYTVSAEQIDVKPGQEFPVFVYVVMPCEELGDFTFDFIADSEKGVMVVPFDLNIRECYDLGVTPGQPDFEEFTAGSGSYEFCIDGTYLMPIKLENLGELDDVYAIKLDYEFINTSKYSVFLNPEESDVIYIQSQAPEGSYNFSIIIDSEHVAVDLPVTMDIVNCSARKSIPTATQTLVTIFLVVLLLVLVVFAYLLFSGKSEKQAKLIESKWNWSLTWKIIVGIAVLVLLILFIIYLPEIKAGLSWLWNIIFNFVKLYWIYFLIGLVAFIMIVLYYWRSGKDKLTTAWFWGIVGLVVLFLVMSLCFFTGICGFVQPDYVNQTNDTGLVESSTVYVWKKNAVEEIDLSDYISNPDKDELEIIVTPVENISIEIHGMSIKLIPEQDFFGERTINFIADDGRGGRAISPDITLIVLNEETTRWDPVVDFMKKYTNYVMAVIFIIVIAVILMVLKISSPKKKTVLVRKKKIKK